MLTVESRKGETDRDNQDSSRETRAMARSLAVSQRGPPTPVFLELHILKGFKSFVLKLRILWELETGFLEMRILKGIARGEVEKFESWKVWRSRREDKERELNAETVSVHTEERSREGEYERVECDESMRYGSMVCDYCQGLLLKEHHSNGAGGSRGV